MTGVGVAPGVGDPEGVGVGPPGPAGVPLAEAVGLTPVGAGAGVGVVTGSPKPGGRIDSGLSWPSAGSPAPINSAATAATATLVRKIRKRHRFLDPDLRFFMRTSGKDEQPPDHHDQNDNQRNQRTGHG